MSADRIGLHSVLFHYLAASLKNSLSCDSVLLLEDQFIVPFICIFYSTMALCNVLQFFVNTGDKRLSSIIVKGERIFQQDEGNKKFQTSKLRLKIFCMSGMLASIIFRETREPLTETLIYRERRSFIGSSSCMFQEWMHRV